MCGYGFKKKIRTVFVTVRIGLDDGQLTVSSSSIWMFPLVSK